MTTRRERGLLSTTIPRLGKVFSSLALDLKYASRSLRRQPGFSLAVALTLALGLGLNATILGMMDALILRPFQFPGYERLVVVWEHPVESAEREAVSPANFLDWRREATSVRNLVAWEGWAATLSGRDEPERVLGFRVSPGFFETLGVNPATRRGFAPTEEEPGRDRVVVLGDGLWKRRFGGDAAVVGAEILLDGEPYTVVGIAPPGFDFPVGSQFWAPLAFTPARAADRRSRALTVLGRLAEGRSLSDAQSEVDVISRRLEQEYPDTNRERGASVVTLSTAFREGSSGSLVGILQAGALFVLLIACANLIGLLLTRATDRQREWAVRGALGAGRAQIVRQLITETVLLGLVASGLALFLAWAGLEVLRSSMPAEIAVHVEGWNNVRLDGRLVLVIPALAIGLGLVIGLIPAAAARRTSLTTALKEGERGGTGGVKRQRIRQGLVAAEIALALALLVTAGLALGGGVRMVNQPGGFDAGRLLTFEIAVPEARYDDDGERRELATNLVAELEAIPGAESAALASVLPAAGWNPTVPFVVEEDPTPDPARRPRTGFRAVTPGYFEAMRIPIVAGRALSTFDREGTLPVAVVSASLAAELWPGRDPLGRRLRLDEDAAGTWLTVVGIARDVTMYNWWDGIDYTAVYVPLRQTSHSGGFSGVVRTAGEPAAIAGAARRAVASVDPLMAIDRVRSMEEAITESTFGLNFLGSLMALCGAIALALSLVGIYSMMAYAVSQRRHEFGVRIALGATARDILRLTLAQAAAITAVGLAFGIALATALGYAMSSALFGLVALEPETFVGICAALAVVALAAAYMPARRSLRLDPTAVLRAE